MGMTGPQLGELAEALEDAFDTASFDRMLFYRLDVRRGNIVSNIGFLDVLLAVLEYFNRRDRVGDLIQASRGANPENQALFLVGQRLGGATQTPDQRTLERTILKTNRMLDVACWRERLAVLENRVCRVEFQQDAGNRAVGTGFLVGPSAVITNFHVMEPVIAGTVPAENVVLRFDYKRFVDGSVNQGVAFKVANVDWLIDQSPYSALDERIDPHDQVPRADELDYVLVRVGNEPGRKPIGGFKAEPNAVTRGWIELRDPGYTFGPHTPILILQHPLGEPLKLALDMSAVLEGGLNANRTRVRYRTNTEPGSSGSPCFDQNWDLVALHHSGDPNFQRLHKPEYNQGIPIAAIAALLERRGRLELVAE